jgi:hypothetical protein
MASVVLVVVAAGSKYAHASVPFVNGNEFGILLLAHLVLVIGCIVRGL